MRSWFQRFELFSTSESNGVFHSANEFRKILNSERLRSDRSGNTFSLLTFWSRERSAFKQHRIFLEAVFASRLRATDMAGMLDRGKIGIVLPYTHAAGAWKLADDLLPVVSTRINRLNCEVFEYPPDEPDDETGDLETSLQPGETLVSQTEQVLLMQANAWWEPVLDIAGAVTGLILLSPLMLLAAAAVKMTSPGPILFYQRRAGRFGKPFVIYKFRSMYAGADAMQAALRVKNEQDGPAFKMSDDPRVTRVGRVLRSTSIDELPQFFNVLRREMSLVGPRPLPVHESIACKSWQRRRLQVRPGMTCVWQIYGRSGVSFDQWMRMDLAYLRSRSFMTDLKLLLKTVPVVLYRKGAK